MTTINMIEQGASRFYEHGNARLFETEDRDYYFFEHMTLGDEGFCGGVWVKGNHITDYDGVYNLPRSVEEILNNLGYTWMHDAIEPQEVDHDKV